MPALTGEGFRKVGFWSQLVLLALVDWASITAFVRQGAAAYHWGGLVAVNAVLLGLTIVVWRWLRRQSGSRPKDAARP